MNDGSAIRILLIVAFACSIVSAVISIVIDIKIPLKLIVIFAFSFGSLAVMVFQMLREDIRKIADPDKPKIAHEHRDFQALANIARTLNGTYEVMGRAAKVNITYSGTEIAITARAGVANQQLIMSSRMSRDGFHLEVSDQPVRRNDISAFQWGDETLVRVLYIGSNNVVLARKVLESCFHEILKSGQKVILTTVRGNLELRKSLPAFDEGNFMEALDNFRSILHVIQRDA